MSEDDCYDGFLPALARVGDDVTLTWEIVSRVLYEMRNAENAYGPGGPLPARRLGRPGARLA